MRAIIFVSYSIKKRVVREELRWALWEDDIGYGEVSAWAGVHFPVVRK